MVAYINSNSLPAFLYFQQGRKFKPIEPDFTRLRLPWYRKPSSELERLHFQWIENDVEQDHSLHGETQAGVAEVITAGIQEYPYATLDSKTQAEVSEVLEKLIEDTCGQQEIEVICIDDDDDDEQMRHVDNVSYAYAEKT